MRQQVNRDLMIGYINADLIHRADLDMRCSVVFYDEAGVFEAAAHRMPNRQQLARLRRETAVRYWSRGIA